WSSDVCSSDLFQTMGGWCRASVSQARARGVVVSCSRHLAVWTVSSCRSIYRDCGEQFFRSPPVLLCPAHLSCSPCHPFWPVLRTVSELGVHFRHGGDF